MRMRKFVPFLMCSFISSVYVEGCKSSGGGASQDSDVDGIGDFFRSIPIPSPKSSAELRTLVKKLVVEGAKQTGRGVGPEIMQVQMKTALFDGIIEIRGLPRWQISQVLSEVLSPKAALCAGVPCNRVFGVEEKDIEAFLDGLYKEVESSAELKKSANAEKRKILLGSLKQENKTPNQQLSAKVSFKDPTIETIVARKLNIQGSLTYGDLEKVTDLELDTWRLSRGRTLPKLEDLSKLPNLRKFTLRYHGTEMPAELAKYGKNIPELFLDKYSHIEHRLHVGIPITLRELDGFATNTKLRSLSLSGFYASDLDSLGKKFYHLESLGIGLQPGLTDAMVDSLARMPNLRNFRINVGYDQIHVSPEKRFPRSITAIHYDGLNIRGCSDLAQLKVFSLASTMTVSNCRIQALGPADTAFNWQILELKDCTKEGGDQNKLFVKENLPRLKVFTTNRPYNIDIDEVSKKELAIRIAQDAAN